MIEIISVHCPKCSREFRTVPSVVEHAGAVYCPKCGARMEISNPMPVSVLSKTRGRANAA